MGHQRDLQSKKLKIMNKLKIIEHQSDLIRKRLKIMPI